MSKVNQWYGWKPDTPDIRDHEFSLEKFGVKRPYLLFPPAKVDLRDKFPPCFDQGELGSCTANAIAGALVYDQGTQGQQFTTPSRLFIYYNERNMEGTVNEDSGAMIRDGVKSVNQLGVCPETTWPYVISQFTQHPSQQAVTEALQHKAVQYARVEQTYRGLTSCLAAGFPVVFGFAVYESFESDEVAQTGVLNMPSKTEQMVGGHAVLCVGYVKKDHRVIVRNSWGTDWGQNGYFTMPWSYILNTHLADDFWAIQRIM